MNEMVILDHSQITYTLAGRGGRRGWGSREKRTSIVLMMSFYCLKAYKAEGGVWKSPNLSIHTLWMISLGENKSCYDANDLLLTLNLCKHCSDKTIVYIKFRAS